MTTLLLLLATLAVGYLTGRARPGRRAADWAAWWRHAPHPTGLRYAAVVAVTCTDNLAWAATHPHQVWQHRRNRTTEETR